MLIRAGCENTYWQRYGAEWADACHRNLPGVEVEIHLVNPRDEVYHDADEHCDRVSWTETDLDPVIYSTYARFIATQKQEPVIWCDIDGRPTASMRELDLEFMIEIAPVLRFTRFKRGAWHDGFWLFGTADPDIIQGVERTALNTIERDFRWGTDVQVNDYLAQYTQHRVDGVCGSRWQFLTSKDKR